MPSRRELIAYNRAEPTQLTDTVLVKKERPRLAPWPLVLFRLESPPQCLATRVLLPFKHQDIRVSPARCVRGHGQRLEI
jgi:hypothetical protein